MLLLHLASLLAVVLLCSRPAVVQGQNAEVFFSVPVVSPVTVTENTTAFACIDFRNVNDSTPPVVIRVRTIDGSALGGTSFDYQSLDVTQTIVVNSFANIACFQFEIFDDGIDETNEEFTLNLTTTSGDVSVDGGTFEYVIAGVVDPSPTPSPVMEATPTPTPTPIPVGSTGEDPHYSILLPTGDLLCYTIQGMPGLVFNLISTNNFHINALFVQDSVREEVTWIGKLGLVVHPKGLRMNSTHGTTVVFDSKTKQVKVGEGKKTSLINAKDLESIVIKSGAPILVGSQPESDKASGQGHDERHVEVKLSWEEIGLVFTVRFGREHLDMYWNKIGMDNARSHGIVGQFFRNGVEIDHVRKLLIMPNKEPVPVMRRPVWSFMERDVADDQLCWMAMNPGYQGKGLIDGIYESYEVNSIINGDFVFKV